MSEGVLFVGRAIRKLRLRARITQAGLGFPSGTISGIERGTSAPSIRMVISIARAMDVRPSEVFSVACQMAGYDYLMPGGHSRMRFGQLVQSIRRSISMSVQELAERVGMHTASLYNIEAGRRDPSVSILWRIAEELGVTPFELVDRSEGWQSPIITPKVRAISISLEVLDDLAITVEKSSFIFRETTNRVMASVVSRHQLTRGPNGFYDMDILIAVVQAMGLEIQLLEDRHVPVPAGSGYFLRDLEIQLKKYERYVCNGEN